MGKLVLYRETIMFYVLTWWSPQTDGRSSRKLELCT